MTNKNRDLRHVAIIVDGNRRWAKEQGKEPSYGHRVGILETLPKIAEHTMQTNIPEVSFWLFSTENWNRDPKEVEYLMALFSKLLTTLTPLARKYGTKIVHLGRKDRIPSNLLNSLQVAESEAKLAENGRINLCIDYGGKDEIVRGINKLLQTSVPRQGITEISFKEYLDTKESCEPDLIIRTGGDKRTSGFMIWGGSYSELFFEKTYFPAYTSGLLDLALQDFAKRNRRFGGN